MSKFKDGQQIVPKSRNYFIKFAKDNWGWDEIVKNYDEELKYAKEVVVRENLGNGNIDVYIDGKYSRAYYHEDCFVPYVDKYEEVIKKHDYYVLKGELIKLVKIDDKYSLMDVKTNFIFGKIDIKKLEPVV